MTLPEFLVARIAEDAAEVVDWPIDGHWGRHPSGAMWLDPHGRPIYAPRARVLAECEAKRRIVEACSDFEAIKTPLYALAAVYADHPDYQPEWKH